MNEGFCTKCSFIIEDFKNLSECPNCGTGSLPCSLENQVTVSVNIHELRLLCIWSENHAHSIEKEAKGSLDTVYAIAARLRRQLGDKDTHLTMADELSEVAKKYPNAKTNHPSADQPENPKQFFDPNLLEEK